MKTKEIIICDKCKTYITSPTEGFIVQGNIYVSSLESRGGLIGNNFPTNENSENITKFIINDVKESAFCNLCMFQMLYSSDISISDLNKIKNKINNFLNIGISIRLK